MQATADAISLKPPSSGHWSGPLVLALVAHALLMAALTWGVHWQHDPTPVAVEAELWSRLPQQAAPRAVEPPPPPPRPAPKPEPRPEPPPEPVARETPPPPPAKKAPDITTSQAKKQQEEADRRAREQAEKARLAKAQADKAKADKAKAERDKKAAEDKRLAEQRQKQEQARKDAQERRDAELTQQARDEQMRRIMGQAGATGGPRATGTAQQSSGPSAGYGARVAARIRPNVLFTDPVAGNPSAEIEVRALPDGTITGRRLVRSSGNPAWDKAALDAIDRTVALPRDVDGRVPSPMIVSMRPQD